MPSFVHMKRQEGWRAAFRGLTLPCFEFHHAYILSKSLTELPAPASPRSDVEFKVLAPADLKLLASIVPPLRVRRFARKMQAGELCFAGLGEGSIIAFQWASLPNGPTAKEMPFQLGSNEVYLWGAYCLPKHRARGIMTAMTRHVLHWLQNQGYEQVFLMTNRRNQPALTLTRKAGFQIVARLIALRIFKWRIFRHTELKVDGC
jgi:ribosomal protein S18 acetylase RimI-like enzyme